MRKNWLTRTLLPALLLVAGGLVQTAVFSQPGAGANIMSAKSDALPSDPNATPETIHLYHYLQTIGRTGYLFGHQDDLAYGVGWKYQPGRSDIRDVTGDYPAVYGWELGRLELDHAVNLDSVPFDRMKAFIRVGYERGGVITISWHLNNLLTGGTAWDPPAKRTMASILPGGEKHALYTAWLDKVAAFLQDLKGPKGEYIPVILRLFHEINGDWFWWGGKNAASEESISLWHFTIDYLRHTKSIHHLLYAYNTDRFATEAAYLAKYPGDQYIDIMGFDIYQRGAGAATNEAFARQLDTTITLLESIAKTHGKIPALTEFGNNGLADDSWWTRTLQPVLDRHALAYVMAWRNAGDKGGGQSEFYVPYPGQASATDFKRFYNSGKTLFQKDVAKQHLYR